MNEQKASDFLKVLAHPARLRILKGLLRHACHVGEIARGMGLPQSTVSQHLSIMRKGGLIVPHKKGVKTCYRVVEPRAFKILDILK